MLRSLLQVVLGVLSAYHLAMGLLSIVSLPATARVAGALYGVRLTDGPQLRYVVRMLGLSALALGALLAVACVRPEQSRATIAVVAALQLARAASRVVLRRELGTSFGVTPSRNAIAVVLLLAEAAVLITGLLVISPEAPRNT